MQLGRMKHLRWTLLIGSLISAKPAFSVDLLTGLGGERGYGEQVMSPTDDGSSNELNLPFDINFYGRTYASFWINNNGNITFDSALGSFTPSAFPVSNVPMIAPFWADVDTRGTPAEDAPAGSNAVWVGSPDPDTVVVTWDKVGYFASHTEKTNDFQLVLRNRSDLANGDFDVEFRYSRLQWTTGDASGGSEGLGGIPAQAGYDAGDGFNFQTLPGSLTDDVLKLADSTNVTGGLNGFFLFEIRSGCLPGDCAANPIMPVVNLDREWSFDFNIQADRPIFIDPDLAIGYDYRVDAGPGIASFTLPSAGDNLFDVYTTDANGNWVLTAQNIPSGTDFVFSDAVSAFRILGIELAANLDPDDPNAFVTRLTFAGDGTVNMRMLPIVTSVPVPAAWVLFASATALFARMGRRRTA